MARITIGEAISYFDQQVPNQYSQEEKVKWLSELDEMIYNEIISVRENPVVESWLPYEEGDIDSLLLVPSPFTDIYRYWLEKSVAYANREMASFNNAMTMYNTYYDNYLASYNRDHSISARYRYNLW